MPSTPAKTPIYPLNAPLPEYLTSYDPAIRPSQPPAKTSMKDIIKTWIEKDAEKNQLGVTALLGFFGALAAVLIVVIVSVNYRWMQEATGPAAETEKYTARRDALAVEHATIESRRGLLHDIQKLAERGWTYEQVESLYKELQTD